MWPELDQVRTIQIEKYIKKSISSVLYPNGCKIWIGSCNGRPGNYTPRWNFRDGNKIVYVNVNKYLMRKKFNIDINDKRQVNHICNEPFGPCVNEDHMYVGTQKQNVRDMFVAGNAADHSGINNGMALLNEQDVLSIKQLLVSGVTNRFIAKKFNISEALVSLIRHGKRWTHIKLDPVSVN
jgi:hypothetical protein